MTVGKGFQTVFALHDFEAEDADEISFRAGDPLVVLEKDDEYLDGWWLGKTRAGAVGLFPANYTAVSELNPQPRGASHHNPAAAAATQHQQQKQQHQRQHHHLPPSLNKNFYSPRAACTSSPRPSKQRQSLLPSQRDSWREATKEIDFGNHRDAIGHSTLANDVIEDASIPSNGSHHPHPLSPHDPSSTSASPKDMTFRTRHPRTWTVSEVVAHIARSGFRQYASHFRHNEISGDVLLDLDMNALKEMEILVLGKRYQLMNLINALREEWGMEKVGVDRASGSAPRSSGSVGNLSTVEVGFQVERRVSTPKVLSPGQLEEMMGKSLSLSGSNAPSASFSSPPATFQQPSAGPSSNPYISPSSADGGAPPLSPEASAVAGESGMHASGASGLNGYSSQASVTGKDYSQSGHNDSWSRAEATSAGRSPASALAIVPASVPQRPVPVPETYNFAGPPILYPPSSFEPTPVPDVRARDLGPLDLESTLRTLDDTSGTGHPVSSSSLKKRYLAIRDTKMYFFKKRDSKCYFALDVRQGYRVSTSDPVVTNSKMIFRLEQTSKSSKPKRYYFMADDNKTFREWIRHLTKLLIHHTQHEASKPPRSANCVPNGTDAVEIIHNPRDVIGQIRVGGIDVSELGYHKNLAQEFIEQSKFPARERHDFSPQPGPGPVHENGSGLGVDMAVMFRGRAGSHGDLLGRGAPGGYPGGLPQQPLPRSHSQYSSPLLPPHLQCRLAPNSSLLPGSQSSPSSLMPNRGLSPSGGHGQPLTVGSPMASAPQRPVSPPLSTPTCHISPAAGCVYPPAFRGYGYE